MDPRRLSEALSGVALLAGLSQQGIAEAASAAQLRELSQGERVFAQDDPGARAHVLLSGSVRIVRCGVDGHQTVMRLIGPGETFGTMALFTDHRYPADAVAMTESLEASWSEAQFLALMRVHHQLALNIIHVVGLRLQEAQIRLEELSSLPVERRLAAALLRLGGADQHDGQPLAYPLRRRDLAEIAGSTLHTVSRILAAWEKAGWLVTSDRRITLLRTADMRRLAGFAP